MAEVRDDRKYAKSHEWVKVDGDIATIGITDYAQEELTDVVFVELPAKGDTFAAGEQFGTVESVKSVSDLYAPVSGEVVEANTSLEDTPETVNGSPFDDGWMVKLKVSGDIDAELAKLLDHAAYEKETA